jgi:hypothetical protein
VPSEERRDVVRRSSEQPHVLGEVRDARNEAHQQISDVDERRVGRKPLGDGLGRPDQGLILGDELLNAESSEATLWWEPGLPATHASGDGVDRRPSILVRVQRTRDLHPGLCRAARLCP